MNAQEIEPTEEQYEELLNEIYGDVEIAGFSYATGYALKELDPIAFRCRYSDYCASETRWECDECGSEYDNEEEAEECCQEEEEEFDYDE